MSLHRAAFTVVLFASLVLASATDNHAFSEDDGGSTALSRRSLKETSTSAWRFPSDMPFLEALSTCETLKCVRDAHLQPKGDAKFNFPHFMIAGWSKSATTSLYKHLNDHPTVLHPHEKEPMLFTNHCRVKGLKLECPDHRVLAYIHEILKVDDFVAGNGQMAPYEATPRIMGDGPNLAEIFRDLMPWVKIIASLREPISRGMSKFIMWEEKFQKGCLMRHDMAWCLLNNEEEDFGNPKEDYYSHAIKSWLDNFPTDQIMLLQYEDLIGELQVEELMRVKSFIGIDPHVPENTLELSDTNCRKCRIQPEGWDMKEKAYRNLIEMVAPDVDEVVRLVDKYHLGNGTRWRENWQKVWDANLASCGADGWCKIKLS